jgi:hypothetical protein
MGGPVARPTRMTIIPWEVVVAPGIEVGEDQRIHLPD